MLPLWRISNLNWKYYSGIKSTGSEIDCGGGGLQTKSMEPLAKKCLFVTHTWVDVTLVYRCFRLIVTWRLIGSTNCWPFKSWIGIIVSGSEDNNISVNQYMYLLVGVTAWYYQGLLVFNDEYNPASVTCKTSLSFIPPPTVWVIQCGVESYFINLWHKPEPRSSNGLQQRWIRMLMLMGGASDASLTHCGRDKMAAILQTTFSNAFSGTKMCELWLKLHWSLFLRAQLQFSNIDSCSGLPSQYLD